MTFVQDVSGNTINKSTSGAVTVTPTVGQTGALQIKMSEN